MYIRHDVHVDRPATDIRRELLREPESWVPSSVGDPLGKRRYLARVGFSAPAARITKQVELTVGDPRAEGDWLMVPVAWRDEALMHSVAEATIRDFVESVAARLSELAASRPA